MQNTSRAQPPYLRFFPSPIKPLRFSIKLPQLFLALQSQMHSAIHLTGAVGPIADPFPYWHDDQQTQGDLAPPLDLFVDAPMEGDAREPVSFRNALMNAGLLHILHNATVHMGAAMGELYHTTVHQLSHVAKLMKQAEYKDRLLQRCFTDSISRQFHTMVLLGKHVHIGS